MYLQSYTGMRRKKGKCRWCLPLMHVVGALFFLIPNAVAQQTLLESLQAAKQNGTEIRKQESRIRAADADIFNATAVLMPDVFLEVGAGTYTRKPAYPPKHSSVRERGGYSNINLKASQLLFDSGERKFVIDAAYMKKKVEASRLKLIEQQTLMNATKAHYNVIYSRSVVAELKSQLKVVRGETEKETRRFENGAATLQEVSLVGAYQASVERAFLEAETDLRKSLQNYKQQSGRTPVKHLLANNNWLKLPKTISEAIETAKSEHPVLALNQSLADQMVAQGKAQEVSFRPKLYLEGNISKGERPEHAYTDVASIGFRLAIPLVSQTAIEKSVLPEKEELLRHPLDADAIFADILNDVETVFLSVADSWKKLSVSRRAAKNARLAYEAARLGRDEHLLSTSDMLEVHAVMLDANLQKLRIERELRIAEYALLFSIGRLTLDSLDNSLERIPVPTPRVIMFPSEKGKAKAEGVSDNVDYWQGLRAAFVNRSRAERVIHRNVDNDR